MIIYKCDICKIEIKEMTDYTPRGEMTTIEKEFKFIKSGAEKGVLITKYLYCEDCAKKVKDYAKGLIKAE